MKCRSLSNKKIGFQLRRGAVASARQCKLVVHDRQINGYIISLTKCMVKWKSNREANATKNVRAMRVCGIHWQERARARELA